MKKRKLVSALIALSMMFSGVNAFAEESFIEKIASSKNGAEIAKLLDGDTLGESGLELSDYKKLKYRDYIGEAIYNSPHSDAIEIETAFNEVMSEAVVEKSINTFSIGAVLNTTGAAVGNDKNGLQFKSGIIRTGNTAGITGYVIYNEIENPSLIMELTADVTGANAGSSFSNGSLNDRGIVISSFTTNGVPSSITNTNALTTYLPDTNEYKAFVDYVDTFNVLENKINVGFELGEKVNSGVDLSAILPSLNAISSNTTPLVFRLSDAVQNNSLNAMKLNMKYDMTVLWEKQCTTSPQNGASGIKDITDIEFTWAEAIDTQNWNKNNVVLKINGEDAEYSLGFASDTLTYVSVDALVDEAYYEIYVKNIGDDIRDRVISFRTTRSNDSLPTAQIIVSGVTSDNIESGSTISADYIYDDADGDEDTLTTYGWYVSNSYDGKYTLLSDSKEITVGDELLGKYIRFEVVPANSYGTGEKETSSSYRVTLSPEEQNVIDKINNSDIYSIGDIISSNLELLGVEAVEVLNPSYIYAELVTEDYLTISQFKEAYERIYEKYTPKIERVSAYGASFNNTGEAQNGVSIYNGLSFVEKPSNGRYDTSSYFWFDVDNAESVKEGSITIEAQHTDDRLSYITGFSLIAPPYIGELNEKIPPEDEKFALWKGYVENDFTKLDTPLVVEHSGKASVTIDIPQEILSAINGAKEGSMLVIEFSKPSSGCSNNNITSAKINLDYDLTKSYQGDLITVPENFAKGVNPIDAEYILSFENEINADNAEISVVNTKTGKDILLSTDISEKEIKLFMEEELLPNTLYCVSVKNIEGMSEIIRYFTTDSLMAGIDVFANMALSVGDTSNISFNGYNQDSETVTASNAQLASSDLAVAELEGTQLKAKKRGTSVIKAVYNNYDGSQISKSLFAVVGNIVKSEDFESYLGADSSISYSGAKSFKPSEKAVLAENIKGKLILSFYDDLESKGKIYLENENTSLDVLSAYTPVKGWHQLYCGDGDVYIDGTKVAEAEFSKLCAEGVRVDSLFEIDTVGTVCTAESVTVRGANASLTSAYAGAVLSGSYTYNDADKDEENGTLKEWYKVSGGTKTKVGEGESLNTSGLSGYSVVFAVTPKNIYESGQTVYSNSISIVAQSQSGGGGGGGGGGNSYYTTTQSTMPDLSVDYSSAPSESENGIFADLSKSHWAYSQIEELSKAGIISGRENNRFCPDDNITRAEFIKLLVYALDIDEGVYNGEFTDISKDDWYAGVVKAAVDKGFAQGYEDGSFAPNKNVTREEMTKLVCVAANVLEQNTENVFTDDANISSWAKPYVYTAVSAGLVNGMDNNTFAPLQNATRAQAAVIISRLIN